MMISNNYANKRHWIRALVLAILLISASFSTLAAAPRVDRLRLGQHPDKTRVVLELSEAADYRAFVLDNPYRVVIDVPAGHWQAPAGIAAGDIVAIRTSAPQVDRLRIVLDTKQPLVIASAFTLSAPARIVLDLKPADPSYFTSQKSKRFGTLRETTPAAQADALGSLIRDTVAAPSPPKKPSSAQGLLLPPRKPVVRKHVIVLDAGHGGNDPGAIAANGVKEKNITLAFVRELKAALEATGRYQVFLTRDRDVYLKLYQRVDIARGRNADLFMSLHADSMPKRDVRGASVYTLSEKASDKETARLADQENRVDMIAGVDLSHEEAEVANILIDLAMRETMNESKFLANILVDSMKDQKLRVLPNTHRYAGFAVLKAADIPSVLIELGFLSSPREAKLLSSKDHRRNLARAILAGIENYFVRLEALQRS